MKNLYMTGGAWGIIYQLGAITQLREIIKKNDTKLYGCSAGALSLVMMLLYDDAYILELYKSFMREAHDTVLVKTFVYDSYNLTNYHFKVFDILHLEHPDTYLKLNDKLNIGITTENGFQWRNTFTSNKDLFNVLLCSFHVPILCSYNACVDDKKCIDGGFGINVDKDLPDDCFVVCPKEHNPEKTSHKYINGNIPLLFCITPPIDIITTYFYNKGIHDIIQYNKTGETSTSKLFNIDECNCPISLWWLYRRLQSIDTKNDISRYDRKF